MKKYVLYLMLVTLLLFASACSTSETSGGNSGEVVQGKKQDLVVALGAETTTLDPQNTNNTIAYSMVGLIYDNLVAFDEEGKIVPQLATEWKIADDATSVTFTLREGVTFHDGTVVNAEAVKGSFDRMLDPNNKLARASVYSSFIESIQVNDEYEITFILKSPFGPVLATFAHPAGGIHSPTNLEQHADDINNYPVGSGPFKFKEWIQGDRLVVEPYSEYWGEASDLNSIIIKPIPENSSRALLLETGEADVISPVSVTDVKRLSEDSDELSIIQFPSNRTLFIAINTQQPILENAKVRQAINYAVNKEVIVDKILSGQGKLQTSPISDQVWGYKSVGPYPYDVEKAKQLLKEAGIKPGTTIKLWTPEGRYPMDRQIAEFVQANLQEVGFDVKFQTMEWGAFAAAMTGEEKHHDLALMGYAVVTNDADWGLRPNFKTGEYNNFAMFANEEVDRLLEEGMTTVDESSRLAAYQKAQDIIHEEAPWLFLAELSQPVGIRNNIEGVYTSNTEMLILRNAVKK